MKSYELDMYVYTEEQKQYLEKAHSLSQIFAARAKSFDEQGAFPFENYADLKEAGFLELTIPKKYGGKGISLTTLLLIMEQIGRGDASTALGLGWHLGILLNLFHTQAWDEKNYQKICREVIERGAMINSCSTEPETGSPSRGGKPQTTAKLVEDSWIINGRKTWSTLSPILDYFIVSASIEGTEETGAFLVPRKAQGLSIEDTWNSMSMRGTGSHDVILNQVQVPLEAIVERKSLADHSKKNKDGGGWLLHVAACYLGVAQAARDFAVQFANDYQPNSLGGPIAELPQVRDKVGKMEIELIPARALVYQMAKVWDEYPDERMGLKPEFAAAKYTATNSAVRVIDLAMRIVGGRSILKEYPLERYYRDVRAGLHNPPMDDVTILWLAQKALSTDRNE
ncbi:acyl-CoA dehydrogenase family protein [Caldalkalibacillus mannanilyticus]|uniref:acyl-CoA dehydrogenase family protein n=1 Tax=Caldalkalibacillus mannanilyticus TaxID=1418 RepID=UPI000468E611|nr:acyl-CoA dehydrogenase family protein [Caldalkalibacillus mannanilyticus]